MPRAPAGVARDFYRYSGLGLQFAATVGVFALAGRWLDGRLNSSPWFLIVGVFAGFALGLLSMVKKLPAPPPTRHEPGAAPHERNPQPRSERRSERD